jgi:hypothetical protein
MQLFAAVTAHVKGSSKATVASSQCRCNTTAGFTADMLLLLHTNQKKPYVETCIRHTLACYVTGAHIRIPAGAQQVTGNPAAD